MKVAFARSVVFLMRHLLRESSNMRPLIRLKLWRLQHGLSQGSAAQLLGIGESTLALLESGRLRPTLLQVDTLRLYFGEHVESLFEPVPDCVEGQA